MRKRISHLLLLVLVAAQAHGQGYYFARPAAVGGATYLVDQDFEGAGYDNSETWTESGSGTIDEDYTATVLDGAQSLLTAQSTSDASTLSPTFAGQDEAWMYFLMRPVTIDTSFVRTIASFRSTAGSVMCSLQVQTDGTLRVAMNTTAATVSTISAGTTYHVWFHYKKGTGANAIADVGFSTTGTRPTSGNGFAQTTSGNPTVQTGTIIVGNTQSITQSYIYDKVRVDDAVIGDSPP